MRKDQSFFFKATFEESSVGFAAIDEDLRYVYVNPAMARLNGVPADAHCGRTIGEVVPYLEPLLRPILEKLRRDGQGGGSLELGPDSNLTQASTPWMVGNFFRLTLPNGRPGYGSIVTDATAKRHAEVALLASEARYRELFDATPVPLAVYDVESLQFLAVNEATLRYYGHAREPVLRMTLLDIFLAEEVPRMMATISGSGTGLLVSGPWRHRKKDGSIVEVETHSYPLAFGGRPARIAVIRDLTAQRRAEAERDLLLEQERHARQTAEAANRARDEFLITVSHELRTPLTPILGWAQTLVADEILAPETITAACRAIERNVRAEIRIIDDLLDMSRVVTGKLSLAPAIVNLIDLTREALTSHHLTAEAKGIALTLEGPEEPLLVRGDRERLRQVVWNLLANALKFTRPNGRVSVVLSRNDGHATLTVTDTGIGVDPTFLPRVFERFSQKDSSSTREFGGLGIGLALVRSLIELHGGTVVAASDGDGQGATFTVQLPVVPASGGKTPAARRSVRPPATALLGVHALVVEDDPDGLALVCDVLLHYGARVSAASTADQACTALLTETPDVLVSDLAMAHIDGLDLLRRVRDLEKGTGRQVPAVALTAYADSTHRQRALAAGFQHFMTKPFDVVALVDLVAQVARSHQASPES